MDEDVGWSALTNDDLVDAGTLAPIPEVIALALIGPVQVDRKVDGREGLLDRESRQPGGDGDRPWGRPWRARQATSSN